MIQNWIVGVFKGWHSVPTSGGLKEREYVPLSHGYVIFLLFFSIEHIPMSVMNASFMSHTYLCNME